MTIKTISRGYKQTVQVDLPDGRKAWLSHEAEVGAELDEADTSNLSECYEQLYEIAAAEVVNAIKQQKAQINSATQQVPAASIGGAPARPPRI